ncbi:MAG: aryl-sulfate sulfotransferase, partial [Promethearchaeota archaeon]
MSGLALEKSPVTSKTWHSENYTNVIHFANPETTPMSESGFIFNITSLEGAFPGFTLFDIYGDFNAMLITDLNGTVVREESRWRIVEFINSTHILGFSPEGNATLLNIYTSEMTSLGIRGHHELEYNSNNNTILTLGSYITIINNTYYQLDTIEEYDMEGQLVWSMDTQDFVSPDQLCPFRLEGFALDLTHANSIFFDAEEDTFLLNCRNLNTFYKIDHKTKQVVWGLGEFGDFAMFDRYGNPKANLFYHAHAVEK